MLTKFAVVETLSGASSQDLLEESKLKIRPQSSGIEVRAFVRVTNSQRRPAPGVAIDEVVAEFARSFAGTTRNADPVPDTD